MPLRSRHLGYACAAALLAGCSVAAEIAEAQERRPAGASSSVRRSGQASGQRPPAATDTAGDTSGLMRPALGPASGDGDAPALPGRTAPRSDVVERPGLRPPKTRRSRSPVQGLVRGDFRPSITPQGVAADVQPLQTGVPDLAPLPTAPGPLPAARARRRPVADDPYAPLGLRVGNVTFTPVVGQYLGYDTNPNRLFRNKNPSALSQTEVELGIQSDWSRHDLSGQLRGAYSEYFDNPAARRPEGAGNLRLRLDVSRDTEIDVEGHYLIDTQRPSSPDLNANVVSRPVIFTEGASIGLTQRFNRLIATMRGTIDRYDYEDARLPGGVVLDQSDRAMTQYGLRGRLGYEVHPGLIPFLETYIDTRRYDRARDSNGFARSSDGVSLRGGATVELTRLLTAEVAAGASVRSYEDKRLGTLTSPVADASLAYAMTPLTTIRGTLAAGVDETTIAGARGVRSLRGTLEIAHALRRNLTLTAGIRASDAAYQGVSIDEVGYGAFLRADWRLNRNMALRASYTYDNIRSTVSGASYVSNTFLLGIRLTP